MTIGVDRRDFLRGAAAAVSATTGADVFAADASKTLVIASPATLRGLDLEYDVSLGTVDATCAFYDSLIAYKKIPDPGSPNVMREDIGVHPELPYGLALEGRLAEKWELAPDGKRVTFIMREGVKSVWGNTLTAEDVRYSWARRFNSKGSGSSMASMLGTSLDQIKVGSPQVVALNYSKQTPLVLRLRCKMAALRPTACFSRTSAELDGLSDDRTGGPHGSACGQEVCRDRRRPRDRTGHRACVRARRRRRGGDRPDR